MVILDSAIVLLHPGHLLQAGLLISVCALAMYALASWGGGDG